jgi:hypothetical protein
VAEEAMTKHTSLLGFTTVRESRDRSRKNGAVIIQRLRCHRGKTHVAEGTGQRKTSTQLTGCAWKGRLCVRDEGWNVEFSTTDNLHNHELEYADLVGSATYRHQQQKRYKKVILAAIESLSHIFLPARRIAHYLRGGAETVERSRPDDIGDQDIKNIRGLGLPIVTGKASVLQLAMLTLRVH